MLELVFALIFSILVIFYIGIISLFKREERTDKRLLTFKSGPCAVVFGSSGRIGADITKKLLEGGYTVIGAGRRHSRWLETVSKEGLESYVENKKFQWLRVDTRLYREVFNGLQDVKKIFKKIDVCINASVINANKDWLYDALPTHRDGTDILLKLPSAYSREYRGVYHLLRENSVGNEHSLFTNLVGLLNLNRAEKEIGVELIVNPDNIDPLCDALTVELSQLDSDKTVTIALKNFKITLLSEKYDRHN